VYGKTLGIVGLGRIGSAVARRAKGFGMKILYTARSPKPELEKELDAKFVGLETLLKESDFVTLHVPLTERTRHLIGAKELELMKPTAYLINTSRGPVVDENALVEALGKDEIAGAALDVFEEEPKIHPRLLELDNVVLVPHIGSASIETRSKMAMLAVENLLAVLEGKVPPHLVNPEVIPKLGLK
jgi:glyoxylate reductase